MNDLPLFNNLPAKRVKITFDGGNGGNNPRLGYGDGYGSFQISGQGIQKVNFYEPMSNNAAEILTLIRALKEVKLKYGTQNVYVSIRGDSQLALGWAKKAFMRKPMKFGKNVSQRYKESVEELYSVIAPFTDVQCEWIGRKRVFSLFGH